MKKITAVLLCIVTVFSVMALQGCSKNIETISASALTSPKSDNTLHLTAHRGLSALAPENTLAAFRLAGQTGYYACEFDIHATTDGVWVVMHDDEVKRMTDKKGKISEMSYAEVKECTIDSGNNCKAYPDQKIPNLSDVLDTCIQYSMRPMIEIKSGTADDIKGLMVTLETRELLDDVILISFNSEYLTQIRKSYKDVELWLLVEEITDETVDFCKKLNSGVAFNYKKEDNISRVPDLKKAKLTCAAWTVDSLDAAQSLYDSGVNYITTNLLTP